MPRSACASAGESFTPSPTIATACRLAACSSCGAGVVGTESEVGSQAVDCRGCNAGSTTAASPPF